MKKIMAFIVVLLSFTACNGNSPPSNAIPAGAITPSLVDNIQGGQTDLTGIWTFGCRQSASDELEMHIYTGTQFIALQLGYATSDGSCGGGFTELGKFTADYTIGTSAVATGGWKNGAPAPTAQDGVTTLPAFPTLAHLIISNPVGSGIFANPNPSPDLYWAIDASVPNTPVYFYVTTNGSGNLTSGLPEGAPGAPGGSYFVKQNITTTPVIILLGNNPATLTVGGTYTDAGAMAFDDVDGDITANIVVTGTVNTAVVGSYSITYNVSDAAGNAAATVVRTVNVNAPIGKLNDTGITACANATTNGLACPQVGVAGQDAEFGRDAQAVAGTLVKTGGGSAGFDFTKLDAAGQPLANQAALYVNTPWSCVQDNVTGLMWEVKTGAGLGGLQDANHVYTWFNSDPNTNGGNAGTANGGTCVDTANCDTEKYVAAVNAAGLCGFSDWRLPQTEALRSLVDYSIALPGPKIDTAYFPNAISNFYWSSSPYAANATVAWNVNFYPGNDSVFGKGNNFSVRLVRGGQ